MVDIQQTICLHHFTYLWRRCSRDWVKISNKSSRPNDSCMAILTTKAMTRIERALKIVPKAVLRSRVSSKSWCRASIEGRNLDLDLIMTASDLWFKWRHHSLNRINLHRKLWSLKWQTLIMIGDSTSQTTQAKSEASPLQEYKHSSNRILHRSSRIKELIYYHNQPLRAILLWTSSWQLNNSSILHNQSS